MNVFEFARIVELNRAIIREGGNRCAQAECSTIGVQTNTGWFGASTPPQPSTQKPLGGPMSCPESTTLVNPGSASDGAL